MDKQIAEQSNILEKRVGENVIEDVPQVSIVVPAYNISAYISETLDSALAQTFRNFEIMVVNDGSEDSDALEAILAIYFDKIVYIKQPNRGVASARNTAIAEARGSIIAFLDGDDIWFPEKLATQIQFLEKNNFEMIYCNAKLFGEPLYESRTFMEKAPSSGKVTTESLLNGTCNVLTSATIVKKELLVEHGLFDENAVRIEDFDLWFRLCKNGVKIGYQKDVLLKYRIRAGSLTGNNVQRSERTIAALQLVKEKYDFTNNELAAFQKMLDVSLAELSLEKGKYHLLHGEVAEARKNFAEANSINSSIKLKGLELLLAISPKLVIAIFRKLRPTEYSYIAPNKAQK